MSVCVSLLWAIGAYLVCSNYPLSVVARPSEAVRGVWLTSVDSDVLYSRKGVKDAVDLCARCGINTIFVVTWNKGTTIYPSEVMRKLTGVPMNPAMNGKTPNGRFDRDPLREVLDAAKPLGIKVIAWFEFGFAASFGAPDGGEILRVRPQWASQGQDGKIVSKNNFQWMNGFHPEVQDFMLSLMKEVVRNYDIDGVQGDDRLPAMPNEAGYDDYTVSAYKAEHGGAQPPENRKDETWIQWRADRLTDFMRRLHTELKSLKPNLLISIAPSVYPWSLKEYSQDWVRWLREGLVDIVCPQIYRYDFSSYKRELENFTKRQIPPEYQGRIAPGILLKSGSYLASNEDLRQIIRQNRICGVEGEVFFFFEGIKSRLEFFETFYSSYSSTTSK